MDLLDQIEDATQNLNQLQDSDSEAEQPSLLGFDFDILAISKSLHHEGAPDLLSRIKQRLTGEPDTQQIDVAQKLPQLEIDESEFQDAQTQFLDAQPQDTQLIDFPETLETQRISPIEVTQPETQQQTQVISHQETQVIFPQQTQIPQETQIIPQETQGTQKISLQSLFLDAESDAESEIVPLTSEQRQARIEELAARRKQERLAREKELEADLTHQTLTDEEQDLDAHNDTVVSEANFKDGVSRKELEETEAFLNIQKRHKNIRPDFQSKVTFTKDKLLSAFSDSEDEQQSLGLANIKSSPNTSPVKVDVKASDDLPVTTQSKNTIEVYARNLKRQLLSSPTREEQAHNEKLINLDESDSDLDGTEHSSPLKARSNNMIPSKKYSNDGKELATIPALSKEQKFVVKQQFSKKRGFVPLAPLDLSKQLFANLHKAHLNQLKVHLLNNPDHKILEELEEEEEAMGSILEREMERVANIRRKEKLRERAQAALLNEDKDFQEAEDDEDDQEEVPDSESGSDQGSADESNEEQNDEEQDDEQQDDEISNPKRTIHRIVDSDEETGIRHDDSYMFGSEEQDVHPQEDIITTVSQHHGTEEFGSLPFDDIPDRDESFQLFQNLQPRSGSIISQMEETSMHADTSITVPVFKDLEPSQTQAETQIGETQADDDNITPASVQHGLESLRENTLATIDKDILDDDNDDGLEEDPEIVKQKIAMYEEKIRRKELKARKRRKELERRGVKNVVEGEAEESEDEWQGLGGNDGEFSDQANSEDERMIDNDFNIDLKNDEIRRKFMEEYQVKDQKELEKLLDDIKNHRLTKKVAGSGLDIELSDEEDELLAAYRRQRLQEQQNRLRLNKKMQLMAKNEKVKAFFASIQEQASVIKIDDDDDDDEEDKQEDDEEEVPVKKVIRVEESFVQKQLSFLVTPEDGYEVLQRISRFQHGVGSDDDADDLQALKSRSLSNLTSFKKSESPVLVETETRKRSLDSNATDVDESESDNDFMPKFKKPSVVKSFKSFHEQKGNQVKEGKQFSGVTINKLYKVATGYKSSITRLARGSKLKKPQADLKTSNIKKSIAADRLLNKKKIFSNSGFE